MTRKRFEEIDTSEFSPSRDNPMTKKSSESAYKTIRIYEEDYKKLKSFAFHKETTIVEMVRKAVSLLEAQERE